MTGVKSHKLSRRERAQASRRKLLNAARDSFIESGYHGATMADIAARSGLAVQTVSYFFGTKPKLLNSLMRDTIETAIAESTAELLCAELAVDGLPMDRSAMEALVSGYVGPRPRSPQEAVQLRDARDAAVLRHVPEGVVFDLRSPF